MSIPSVSNSSSRPQTSSTDDVKSTSVDQSKNANASTDIKPEENQCTAKPADSSAQKAEHAMEGQARQAELDASLNNRVDQSKIDQNAKEIKEKLSYGATDWAVTDKEVKEVHDKLNSLSPNEYKAQIEQMKKDGVLDRYTSNMGDAEKKAFLEQGVDKSYLNGGPVKVPDGPLNPPAGPTMYENKKDLPEEVRQVISDHNLGAAKEYDAQYSKYMDRFNGELDKCKNPEDMRKLGHWAPKHPMGQEPGYDNHVGDKFADKWANERFDKTHGDKAAREKAMEKMYQFTGRRPAGDVFVEMEANAKVEVQTRGKTSFGVGGKAGMTAGTGDGVRTSVTAEPGASQEVGPVKFAGGVRTKDGQVSGSVGVNGNEAKVKEDGTFEVKVNQSGDKKKAYGPYASYNPGQADARFGAYATKKGEVGIPGESGAKLKGEVGGKVGFGIRGITGDEVAEALKDGPGYWNDPAELQQGKSWQDLPQETRDRYSKHYGWSEKEWESKLPKYNPDAA